MKEFQIRLSSTQEVGEFVELVTEQSYPVRVSDGEKQANAKSFIGMFGLDCRRPLTVTAQTDDGDELVESLKRFLL